MLADQMQSMIDARSMTEVKERARIAALQALDVLGAPREPALDRIVRMVRLEFGAQHAGIMVIDRDRAAFVARDNVTIKSIPRDEALCNTAIQHSEPLIIHDMLTDPRVHGHPQVARGIRSYAGVPLRTRDGYNIGSLCVFDPETLTISPSSISKMQELALLAMDCIELRRLAIQDHLTGALNRRGFMTELDREIRDLPPGASLALAVVDLDHFKQINDRFGHPAGDSVLQTIVALATAKSQRSEVIGRLGGEEFGILMPGHDELSAFTWIEDLRRTIEALRLTSFPNLTVTASFGIAESGLTAQTSSAMLAQADAALYRAKSGARNMTVLASQFV
ncbi:MAG: diguanylate cyclase domain protein [Cypionkella sp.]|nr:diguanylate cyclase domain protein [Cypionkella sp.]